MLYSLCTYGAESLKPVGTADEGVTVLHAEAIKENCAITVGVSLELHSNRDIVAHGHMLEGLIRDDSLTVFHENGRVLGGLDRRTRVPAEFVAEGIIGLLSDGDAAAVAFIADHLVACLLGLMDDLHGAEDVDTWVKTALIQNDEVSFLGLSVELEHLRGDVATRGHIDAHFDADREYLHVHPGGNEGDHKVYLANSSLHSSGLHDILAYNK